MDDSAGRVTRKHTAHQLTRVLTEHRECGLHRGEVSEDYLGCIADCHVHVNATAHIRRLERLQPGTGHTLGITRVPRYGVQQMHPNRKSAGELPGVPDRMGGRRGEVRRDDDDRWLPAGLWRASGTGRSQAHLH